MKAPVAPHLLRPAQIQALAPAHPVQPARPGHTWPGRGSAHVWRRSAPAPERLPAGATPLKALAGILLLVPLMLIPVLVLWFAGRAVLAEHSVMARFRQVDATVLSTGIERRVPSTAHGAPAWVPRVGYRFEVRGLTYDGNRLTPLDIGGTERWAKRHIEGYRVGDQVTAYYDPQDPRRTFLERQRTPALTATFFLPVPLLAFALLWTARALRKRQHAAAARAPDPSSGGTVRTQQNVAAAHPPGTA